MNPSTSVDRIVAEASIRRARALFQRTLATWASDLLEMQRRGERTPTWTPSPYGTPANSAPATHASPRRKAA